jgi:hypothetical protein
VAWCASAVALPSWLMGGGHRRCRPPPPHTCDSARRSQTGSPTPASSSPSPPPPMERREAEAASVMRSAPAGRERGDAAGTRGVGRRCTLWKEYFSNPHGIREGSCGLVRKGGYDFRCV